MTAAALGVVIFAALVMTLAGLSYAMGAFIAGMMLADSSFRHEVEADIEPFRALFLGLFFVAVGLSLDLGAVADNLPLILAAVPVLIVLKGLAIYAVNRLFGLAAPAGPAHRLRHGAARRVRLRAVLGRRVRADPGSRDRLRRRLDRDAVHGDLVPVRPALPPRREARGARDHRRGLLGRRQLGAGDRLRARGADGRPAG